MRLLIEKIFSLHNSNLGAPVDVGVTLYVISLRDLSDIDMVNLTKSSQRC